MLVDFKALGAQGGAKSESCGDEHVMLPGVSIAAHHVTGDRLPKQIKFWRCGWVVCVQLHLQKKQPPTNSLAQPSFQ